MSTATPPAQPAASRVVPTQEAYRVLKEWADAHPQDQNHDKVVDELAELADPTVWDDESRAAEVAGRLNVLLASARIGVWTAAAVPAPNSTPAPGPRPSWLATWAALAAWQRLVAASAVIVLILAAAAAGAAAGLAAIAAAAAGLVASGRVSLSGGNVAALLAGAGLAGLLAGGQGIVAAMKVAADKDGTQRPQR